MLIIELVQMVVGVTGLLIIGLYGYNAVLNSRRENTGAAFVFKSH